MRFADVGWSDIAATTGLASVVLKAMGYDEAQAGQAIRISLGPDVTEDTVLRFAEAWARDYKRIRSRVA